MTGRCSSDGSACTALAWQPKNVATVADPLRTATTEPDGSGAAWWRPSIRTTSVVRGAEQVDRWQVGGGKSVSQALSTVLCACPERCQHAVVSWFDPGQGSRGARSSSLTFAVRVPHKNRHHLGAVALRLPQRDAHGAQHHLAPLLHKQLERLRGWGHGAARASTMQHLCRAAGQACTHAHAHMGVRACARACVGAPCQLTAPQGPGTESSPRAQGLPGPRWAAAAAAASRLPRAPPPCARAKPWGSEERGSEAGRGGGRGRRAGRVISAITWPCRAVRQTATSPFINRSQHELALTGNSPRRSGGSPQRPESVRAPRRSGRRQQPRAARAVVGQGGRGCRCNQQATAERLRWLPQRQPAAASRQGNTVTEGLLHPTTPSPARTSNRSLSTWLLAPTRSCGRARWRERGDLRGGMSGAGGARTEDLGCGSFAKPGRRAAVARALQTAAAARGAPGACRPRAPRRGGGTRCLLCAAAATPGAAPRSTPATPGRAARRGASPRA